MSKTSDAILKAHRDRAAYDHYSAWIHQVDSWRVVIRAVGTSGRRQRASQVSALKRRIEKEHGCTLTYDHVNYSDCEGFLSRTEVWYRLSDPDARWEVREFSNAFEYRKRGGLVCVTVFHNQGDADKFAAEVFPRFNRSARVFEVRD